jgi:hypothetical protein
VPHSTTRVREWLRRYLPAEAAGLLTALTGALVTQRLTGSPVAAAFAGSICETAGYYATIATRDVARHRRHMSTLRAVARTGRDLTVEFGAAEAVDSLFVRPALMYTGPLLTGGFVSGTVIGKLAADVVFYALAICGYELRKRIFDRQGGTDRVA